MRPPRLWLYLFLGALLLAPLPAFADKIPSEANVGYRSLVTWLPGDRIRVDISVWYPTQRVPGQVLAGTWTFPAARNAPLLPGTWPLVVISHDSSGSRFSHHDLATYLAKKGCIVAALTHDGDNIDDMDLLFTAKQLPLRTRQISACLDTLLDNPDFGPAINQRYVALIGFGSGGTAGLLLAGASMTDELWPEYCDGKLDMNGSGETAFPYCEPDMQRNMTSLADSIAINLERDKLVRNNRELAEESRAGAITQARAAMDKSYPRVSQSQKRPVINFPKPPFFLPLLPPLPERPGLTDDRFKCLILVSPGYSMMFAPQSLENLDLPIFLVAADRDTINLPQQQAEVFRDMLVKASPSLIVLKDADLPSLQALCPPDMASSLPDLCHTVTPQKRSQIHAQMEKAILEFLQQVFR